MVQKWSRDGPGMVQGWSRDGRGGDVDEGACLFCLFSARVWK